MENSGLWARHLAFSYYPFDAVTEIAGDVGSLTYSGGLCGPFCRQTAARLIDTVTMTDT